jgi:hypothetical protein
VSNPDDIERRLREIEAELGPAKFKEPSAAERARQPVQKMGRRSRVRPAGAPVNPYEQGSPVTNDRCQATTGT